MSKKERVFLDEEGNIVTSDSPNLFECRETEWDEKGHLIRSAVYFRKRD